MKHLTISVALAAALGFAACTPRTATGPAGQPRWVATWATAPQLTEPRNMPPAPGLSNTTFRQNFRVSIGGTRLRLHVSNEYGKSPMEIHSMHLAKYLGGGAIDPATDRPLTFNGRPSLTLAAGQTAVSDPLDFDLAPMADLALTTAFGSV